MLTTPVPPPVVVPIAPESAPVGSLPAPGEPVCLEFEPGKRRASRWRLFPPWLASLVLHLNVMILLGLWIGASDRPTRIGGIELGWNEAASGELLTKWASAAPQMEPRWEAVEFAPWSPLNSDSTVKPEIALSLLHASSAASTTNAGSPRGDNGLGDAEAGSLGDEPEATRTSVYSLEGQGKRFVYVFDRSASMNSGFEIKVPGRRPERHTFLDGAKEELLRSLSRLSDRHRFQIIFYNDYPKMFQGYRGMKQMIPANSRAKELASTYLYGLEADRDTYHVPALEMALRLRPDVIFLLTDGEEKDDPSPRDLKDIALQNKGRAAIHVIQICREPRPDSTLVQLARENGGQHAFLKIDELFEALQRNLERQSQLE